MSRWSPNIPLLAIMSSQRWRTTMGFLFMIWPPATTSPCLYPESLSLADWRAGPESLRDLLQRDVLWHSYHLRRVNVVGEAEGLPCLCFGGSEQRREAPAVTRSTYLHGYTPKGGCLPTISHWGLRERRKAWPVPTEPCTRCVRPELENEQMFALH